MLTYHQWSFVVFTAILQAAHEISVHGMNLKITILKLRPHLPGANEFKSQQTPLTALLHVSYGDKMKKQILLYRATLYFVVNKDILD